MNYFLRWPEYNVIAESLDGRTIGYVMGKSEGNGKDWHGHVTVLTVAPAYRRLGMGNRLMAQLEAVSDQGQMWFVDPFVRESNTAAIGMYQRMGYTLYRRVLEYYGNPKEDAYGRCLINTRGSHCLFRYEEGAHTRCQEAVSHTTFSSSARI